MHRIIGNESISMRNSKTSNTVGHGGGIRGDDTPDGSPQFEGSFGRMFRTLPKAEHKISDLDALASAMSAEAERDATGTKPAAANEQDSTACRVSTTLRKIPVSTRVTPTWASSSTMI
jgi:hypothetical protein